MARRFEFEEGGSSKFWEVSLSGDAMTVTFGRLGSAGQSKTKSFASADAAQKEADKLVAEKTRKGYAEVGSAPAASAPAQTPPATTPAPTAASAPEPSPASPPAPARSLTSAPAATTPVPPTTWQGEEVLFSRPSWVAAEAEPAVDTPARARKAPSFEETWKPLIARFDRWEPQGRYAWPTDAAGLPGVDRALVRRARARLESKQPAACFDIELEAYTYALAQLVPAYEAGEDSYALPQRALAHWTGRSDAATAARTMLRVEWLSACDHTSKRRELIVMRRAVEQIAAFAPDGTILQGLREHVRQYGRATIEPVVRELLLPTNVPRRAALAWLLDDEAEATRAVAQARAEGNVAAAMNVLGLVPSAADAAELLRHNYGHEKLLRAVLRHGIALAQPLLSLGVPTRELAYSLACYPSRAAARQLVELLANKQDRKIAGQALANMVPHALVALEEARGKKTKYRDAIDALHATLSSAGASQASTGASSGVNAPAEGDVAPMDSLPAVFGAPPWRAKRKPSQEASFEGLAPRAVDPLIDLSSVDPKQLASEVSRITSRGARASVRTVLDQVANGQWVEARIVIEFSLPQLEELRAAGALAKLSGGEYWVHDGYSPGLTAMLSLHGAAVIPALLALAPALKGALSAELAHAGAVEVGPIAIQWLGAKATRKAAEQWARRFPQHAAAALVPIALGPATGNKAVTERDRARLLLATVARAGHRGVILAEARHHGAEVEAATATLLDRDPLELAPSKPPKLLEGLENLPRITLRDGRLLPPEAATILFQGGFPRSPGK
ncbi:MAG: WGR domain-containing protein, partial [Deltaproteobacteria bacterium]